MCSAKVYVVEIEYIYSGKSPASNYMFKVNNKDTRTRCEICSKLTIKTPKVIVNFEHISQL